MVSLVALFTLTAQSKGALVGVAILEKLGTKVELVGEKGPIDPLVGSFLKLKGIEVHWHSKFDSERQVQTCGKGKERRIVFLVPEKPFPEFGKTWVYCVGADGKLQKAGVSEPREAFKALSNAQMNAKAAKAELDYWLKALEIVKA
jgi:hypothetical protein